jgi:signal transduction histidine kinase
MKKYLSTSTINLIIFGIILFSLRFYLHTKEIAQVKNIYIEEQNVKSYEIADSLKENLKVTYETIRTISLLPGVRALENSKQKLSEDTVSAIQQMYNNIYNNINVSEIYILPKDFDYKTKDLFTQKNQAPLIVFDELITESKGKVQAVKKEDDKKLIEVEDFEYEIQKEQISYLKSNWPNYKKILNFKIPMVSSPEVITCDNSEFTQDNFSKNENQNRMGIVFTVPKYDLNGNLNGAVSAIFRTNVLKSFIPKEYYGLINLGSKSKIISNPSKEWLSSFKSFESGTQNSELIYSKIIPIKTMDLKGWQLWVALPEKLFFETVGYKNAMNHFYIEMLVALIIIFSLFFMQQKIIIKNTELETSNNELKLQKTQLERDNLLLRVLSHDVSNTLTVIKSSSLILKKLISKLDDPKNLAKSFDFLDRLEIASDSAIAGLNHVKEIKALESGKVDLTLEPVAIDTVFHIASVLFENNLTKKNINLKLINKAGDKLFLSHKTSFSNSVFNNIVSNAIKFSPNNSEILITTEIINNHYKISIQDFGVGIPESLAENIFSNNKSISRLGTDGEKGTGFGLSLAKTYVQYYKGSLSFRSSTTGVTGTTFEILLMLA